MSELTAIAPWAKPFLRATQVYAPITCRQVAVLGAIAADEGRTTKVYAGRLGVPLPAVARACATLQSIGVAARDVNSHDRRRVRLRLTQAGRAFADSLAEA